MSDILSSGTTNTGTLTRLDGKTKARTDKTCPDSVPGKSAVKN